MRLINKFIILVYGSMFFSLLNADDVFLNLPNIEEFTLNNGMRVLFSPNYDYPTVYCHVYVNRGMLDDPENAGLLSLVVKNEIFDATEKYSKKGEILELMQTFGDDGGRIDHRRINDYSFEFGSYFLKEDVKPALELYAEILQKPLYPRKGRFWTKMVIPFIPKKDSYNKGSLTSLHLNHLYADIKGSNNRKHYVKQTTNDCKKWHNQYIRPENTTIMITGDVNYLYIKKIIEEYFANWSPIGNTGEKVKYNININDTSDVMVRFINTDFQDAEIRLMVRSASHIDEWYLPSELAKTIFNPGHSNGRLQKIHQKLNFYGEFSQATSTSERLPSTRISGKVKYSNVSKFYDLIISEFKNLSNKSIDDNELESAKKIISNTIKYDLNEPQELTHFIQRQYNVNGYSLEKISEGLQKLNAVTLEDVNDAAAKIYNPNNFILLVMGKRDSCSTFLEKFENVEYYEHTEALRVSANSR